MKNVLIVTLALVALIGVSYWAFDTLRQRTYTGGNLSFEVGSGHVSVINSGDEPVPVEMHSAGRRPFRIKSTALGLQESFVREENGPDVQHVIAFELPPGRATIYVTRGSAVWFVSNSNTRLHATVTPLRTEGIQLTIMFAGTVILVALYWISSIMHHRWIRLLRDKSTGHTLPTAATSRNHHSATS